MFITFGLDKFKKLMDGYVKITLLDQSGKIVNATLCTTQGNLLFAEKNKKPELVEKILACIKNSDSSKTLQTEKYADNPL